MGFVHHGVTHNQDSLIFFPIQLDLAAHDNSRTELQQLLIEGEGLGSQAHSIRLPEMDLVEVKRDLSAFFQTLAV